MKGSDIKKGLEQIIGTIEWFLSEKIEKFKIYNQCYVIAQGQIPKDNTTIQRLKLRLKQKFRTRANIRRKGFVIPFP